VKQHLYRGRGFAAASRAAHRGAASGELRSACQSVVETVEPRVLLSTYFVSTTGSDWARGTLNAPFRTIQHAANLVRPGDTVLIRGGTYHETVTPVRSGTQRAPITFAAYNGENVTIDGADPISGWTRYSGSIWHARVSGGMGLGADQVFIDGQMINEARWPNTSLNLAQPAVAHARAVRGANGIATIYDPNLTQPDGYWNGALIHILPGQGWVSQTAWVRSYRRGQLTFYYQNMDSGTMERPSAGNAYYLFGKFQALDSPGEFYHDPTTGQLYVWTPTGDSPSNHAVEIKERQYAFDVSGKSDIHLDGINFVAATIRSDARSARLVINHLHASYTSQFQVQMSGWNQPIDGGISLMGPQSLLENSVIQYSAGDGVYVGGGLSRVTNTVIHDVDYNAGDSAGIRVMAPWVQVDHNTIYNAGRSGVEHFSWGAKILYNTIHDVMLQTTDGGATYTIRSNGGGTEIAYNRIYNVKTAGFGGAGIYLDNDSSNYIVDHNIVYNVNNALKLNYSSHHEQIYNNTLDATDASVATNTNADWSGSMFANNIFFNRAQFGRGVRLIDNLFANTNPKVMGRGAGNYYLTVSSPAVNRGAMLGSYTSGYMFSRPDIGALEYGLAGFRSGSTITATTPPAVPLTPALASDSDSQNKPKGNAKKPH